MKNITVLIMFILLSACDTSAITDPNEAGVPDAEDFQTTLVNPVGSDISVHVYTFADWNGTPFKMYMRTPDHTYQINVLPTQFTTAINDTGVATSYANEHTGPVSFTGNDISFTVPLTALEVTPPVDIDYWFVKGTIHEPDHDSMPDGGASNGGFATVSLQ